MADEALNIVIGAQVGGLISGIEAAQQQLASLQATATSFAGNLGGLNQSLGTLTGQLNQGAQAHQQSASAVQAHAAATQTLQGPLAAVGGFFSGLIGTLTQGTAAHQQHAAAVTAHASAFSALHGPIQTVDHALTHLIGIFGVGLGAHAIIEEFVQLAEKAEHLENVAFSTGIPVEEFAKISGAIQIATGDADASARVFQSLERAIRNALEDPKSTVAQSFEALKITDADLNKGLENTAEFLLLLSDRAQRFATAAGSDKPALGIAALRDILGGRDIENIAPVLARGPEHFKELMDEAAELQRLNKQAIDALSGSAEEINKIKLAWTGLKVKIYEEFKDPIEESIRSLRLLITNTTDAVEGLQQLLRLRNTISSAGAGAAVGGLVGGVPGALIGGAVGAGGGLLSDLGRESTADEEKAAKAVPLTSVGAEFERRRREINMDRLAGGSPMSPDEESALLASIRGSANFAKTSGALGDPHSASWAAENLTKITSPSGVSLQVNKSMAPAFQGFIDELEGTGYKIGSDSGGFNLRNIAGKNVLSEHAFGNAIDINPDQNPQHGGTNLPANVSAMAAKWGLTWGGDWSAASRDPMHFEGTAAAMKVAQSHVTADSGDDLTSIFAKYGTSVGSGEKESAERMNIKGITEDRDKQLKQLDDELKLLQAQSKLDITMAGEDREQIRAIEARTKARSEEILVQKNLANAEAETRSKGLVRGDTTSNQVELINLQDADEKRRKKEEDADALSAMKELETARDIENKKEQALLQSVERRKQVGELTIGAAATEELTIVENHKAAVEKILADEFKLTEGRKKLYDDVVNRATKAEEEIKLQKQKIEEKAAADEIKRGQAIDKEIASKASSGIIDLAWGKTTPGAAIASTAQDLEKRGLDAVLTKALDASGIGSMLDKAFQSTIGSLFSKGVDTAVGAPVQAAANATAMVPVLGTALTAQVAAQATAITVPIVTAITGAAAGSSAVGAAGSVAGGAGGFFGFLSKILTLEHGGIVPSAAGGWQVPNVGSGSIMAQLHANEMVLPSGISSFIQNAAASGSGKGGAVNLSYAPTIHAPETPNLKQTLNRHGGDMLNWMQAQFRSGALRVPA